MSTTGNWAGLRAEVAKFCREQNIGAEDFRFLDLYEWKNVYDQILDRFVDRYARSTGLHWANMGGFKKGLQEVFWFQVGMNGYPSYEWIEKLPKIIHCEKVYLILEDTSKYKFWIAECSPEVVHLIINELKYYFEYYITDKKYHWIITENHHEVVQFWGDGLDENVIQNVLLGETLMEKFDFFVKLNQECDVRLPEPWDSDWEFCAGDYERTNDYIQFYHKYSSDMDDRMKDLLVNMIVQGVEDYIELTPTPDKAYLGQHHTISSAAAFEKFGPQMRYFFLPYTKYACEKVPFCERKFFQNPLLPNCAVLPLIFCGIK